MALDPTVPWTPSNFLALPPELSDPDKARVVILPVPYDSTTSYKSGTRDGSRAIIEGSYNLEDYDPELDVDVSQLGIFTAPSVEPHLGSPQQMVKRVYNAVYHLASKGKLVVVLGGEHSISIGSVKAQRELYPDLSVLFLDAHADLRDEYMGTNWGHASVARRIYEVMKTPSKRSCPLVLVGVRSLSSEEQKFISQAGVKTFFWPFSGDKEETINRITSLLSPRVYVSIDLDVLDPSIMPAVGTPEPGGMDWYQIISILRTVAEQRRIVGFDVTELNPILGPPACAYTAAKLVYKMIAYATLIQRSPLEGSKGGQGPSFGGTGVPPAFNPPLGQGG